MTAVNPLKRILLGGQKRAHVMRIQFAAGGRRADAERVSLSPREAQVLRLVCHAADDRAIARKLKLSPGTVHQYVWRMMQYLNFHRRSELMLWGLQHQPEVFQGLPVEARLHPERCPCDRPFCAGMRQQRVA